MNNVLKRWVDAISLGVKKVWLVFLFSALLTQALKAEGIGEKWYFRKDLLHKFEQSKDSVNKVKVYAVDIIEDQDGKQGTENSDYMFEDFEWGLPYSAQVVRWGDTTATLNFTREDIDKGYITFTLLFMNEDGSVEKRVANIHVYIVWCEDKKTVNGASVWANQYAVKIDSLKKVFEKDSTDVVEVYLMWSNGEIGEKLAEDMILSNGTEVIVKVSSISGEVTTCQIKLDVNSFKPWAAPEIEFVWWNPAQSMTKCKLPVGTEYLMIVDINWRIVDKRKIDDQLGGDIYDLDVSKLPNWTYFVTALGEWGVGKSTTSKLRVQN